MESTWEVLGCTCSLTIINDGNDVEISVYRMDDPSMGETVIHTLFNPYAFFGYDYEDSIAIDEAIDTLLERYGDPEPKTKFSFTSHIYSKKKTKGKKNE